MTATRNPLQSLRQHATVPRVRLSTVRRSPSLSVAIAVLIAFAVAAPVVSIIALAAVPPPADLWPHLIDYVLPQALADTAMLLAGVGCVTLVAGAATAWVISRHNFPGRGILIWLMPMPLAVPTYISAYVYVDLFEPLGLVHGWLAQAMPMTDAVRLLPNFRSLPGAILLIGLVLYPYVYLSARAMFQLQSAEVHDAAKVLGAGRLTRFLRVWLPMARPALAVGLALVALETLNDIGASEYLGVRTLTVSIFTVWLNRGSLAGAAQIAVLMLGLVCLLIALERYGQRKASVEFSSESPHLMVRTTLDGTRGWLVALGCALPPLFGFVLPLIYLLNEAALRWTPAAASALLRDGLHTVGFALCATLIALGLGLMVMLARRWRPSPLTQFATSVTQMGYALPGLVLALGLLAPLLAIDNGIVALARSLGLPSPGLVLIGSGAAVVTAYVIRFLAVPTGFIGAGFARVPRDYDDTALTAGAPTLTTLRRIHLPLLRPALLGAAIVVFVDCLKELPATLLLRPMNVETLATSIYQFASRGSFEAGAPAALLIVLVSVVPVAWLTRFADLPPGEDA